MSRFWRNLKESFHAYRNVRRELKEFGLSEYTDILKRGRELDAQRANIDKSAQLEEKELMSNISSFFKKVEADVAQFESAQEGALGRMKQKSDADTAEVQKAMKDMRALQQQLLKDLTEQKGSLVQRATQQRLIEITESISSSNNIINGVVSPTQLLEQLKNLSNNTNSNGNATASPSTATSNEEKK